MIVSPPTENWEDDDPTLGINFEMCLAIGKGLMSTDSKAQPGMDYRYREETTRFDGAMV